MTTLSHYFKKFNYSYSNSLAKAVLTTTIDIHLVSIHTRIPSRGIGIDFGGQSGHVPLIN